jgi:transcriptional regulator with XRE-family HTH domain
LTDDVLTYGALFDEDAESREYKLETLALRLSHVIAEAMDDCGMNRADLARALDVSPPMVTKILSGRSNFTLKTLVSLADTLDCEFDPVFRPKDYAVAVEYVFPEASRQARRAAPRSARALRTIALSTYATGGERAWDLTVCSLPEPPPIERAVA